MKCKSFGCSFVFGTDLPDNPESAVLAWPVGQFSRLTWPALMAKTLGMEYECFARPGSGNLQIAERLLNECARHSADLVVVDWTWIDRFDYIKSLDPWQPWGTTRPGDQQNASTNYYKYLHSEYTDKLNTLIYIKTVIDTLLEKGIQFIMTYEDELIFDRRWHVSESIVYLQDYIKPYMTTFDGKTFLDWSRQHGYPESATWHPLELAHRVAAEYMFNVFDKQKTSGPIQQALS